MLSILMLNVRCLSNSHGGLKGLGEEASHTALSSAFPTAETSYQALYWWCI